MQAAWHALLQAAWQAERRKCSNYLAPAAPSSRRLQGWLHGRGETRPRSPNHMGSGVGSHLGDQEEQDGGAAGARKRESGFGVKKRIRISEWVIVGMERSWAVGGSENRDAIAVL